PFHVQEARLHGLRGRPVQLPSADELAAHDHQEDDPEGGELMTPPRRQIMKSAFYTVALVTVALAALLTRTVPSVAGTADSPLPVLTAREKTLHLYSVPGVIAGAGGLETFFSCTSTDTAPMQVGVELFFSGGGAPANDAVATSLTVGPGATVTFGT